MPARVASIAACTTCWSMVVPKERLDLSVARMESSSSSTSLESLSTWRSIASLGRAISWSRLRALISQTLVLMACMWLRNSWDRRARNWSLARSFFSSSSILASRVLVSWGIVVPVCARRPGQRYCPSNRGEFFCPAKGLGYALVPLAQVLQPSATAVHIIGGHANDDLRGRALRRPRPRFPAAEAAPVHALPRAAAVLQEAAG